MIGRRMANIIKHFAKAIANELIAPEPGLARGVVTQPTTYARLWAEARPRLFLRARLRLFLALALLPLRRILRWGGVVFLSPP